MSSTMETEQQLKQGRQLLREGDSAAAIEVFQEIIGKNPDDIIAYESLGTACFHAGDYAAAIEAFQKITRLDPKKANGYINLGAVYNRQREYKNALDALRRALQRDRTSSEAYYNMGMAHKGLNQLSMAVTAYREALRHSPGMAEAHQNLANVFREMKNLKQAETHYLKALEFRPDFERAQHGLEQTRAMIEDQRQASSPLGRLVGDASSAKIVVADPAQIARLTKEDREQIYQAASNAASLARTIASNLNSEFERKILLLSAIVTRGPAHRVLAHEAHEEFRDALGTLVPLFQKLSDRVQQLGDAVKPKGGDGIVSPARSSDRSPD